jgi:ditrans,polycis-polyprenyl diphosphate synthase
MTEATSRETSQEDEPVDQEIMAAYNKIDGIVEQYITDVDPDTSFIAPTDAIVECLQNSSLNEEEKRQQIDAELGNPISNSDFADLKALSTHLDTVASSAASTTLNLSTSDPTNTSSTPPTNYRDPESITADTLTAHTFTGSDTPPLDLLIRTSGVERLSDFMLWQCHQETEIAFLKCMWPEFDLWHFLPVLLEWQWRRRKDNGMEKRRGRKVE